MEDATVVRRLTEILEAHTGRDGVAAVFQPNYVMGSLAWDEAADQWVHYDLPDWPSAYPRPGLWDAVKTAQGRGVWHPEFHATYHYDPVRRRAAGLATDLAREVTRRGISLFPESEGARELAPWRPAALMATELDSSLAVFQRVFGRPVASVIAPDYTWYNEIEEMWQTRGLRIIQAKREQRNPQWMGGKPGRIQKYMDRQWARLVHPGRSYLERNCRLEPVQAADPDLVVQQCVAATRQGWQRGEPIIVETHRVNFSHTDPEVVQIGLEALDNYLTQICAEDDGPLFVCDSEIAQLGRRGTSWRMAGDQLVVRNGTHGTRVVMVPGWVRESYGIAGHGPLMFRLAGGENRLIRVSFEAEMPHQLD